MALETNVVYVVRGADQKTTVDGDVYTADEIEDAADEARKLSRTDGQQVVVPVILSEGKALFRFDKGDAVPPG